MPAHIGRAQYRARHERRRAPQGGSPGDRGGGYRGELGVGGGGARLAVGGWLRKPITAQLMSTSTEPYGAGCSVAVDRR